MQAGAKYPLATLAHYGPDHQTATKLVVSIFKKPGKREPAAMHKWTIASGDIRQDPVVAEAAASFIKSHYVMESISHGGILGCPHEEGVDYSLGGTCPQCPFWDNIDRFTLDPVSLNRPLTPEQIMAGLSCERETPPAMSLAAAEKHQEQMVEPFLQVVERALANPGAVSRADALLIPYALVFLGKWREPRALPLVIRWLAMSAEARLDLAPDYVEKGGARLLAATCDGNLEPIKHLIHDQAANILSRGQAMVALAVLVGWKERPQPEIAEYFAWLAREGLPRERSVLWDSLAGCCVDIEALDVFDDLRRAINEQLINPVYLTPDELARVTASPPGQQLEWFRRRNPPLDNIAIETGWTGLEARSNDSADGVITPLADDQGIPQPYLAPTKTGRNDPCPCGSGKKFKKCCGA